jgi:phospholipase C
MTEPQHLSRRRLLGGALTWAGLATASAVGLSPESASARSVRQRQVPASRKKTKIPGPGTLPAPTAPAGSDQLPQITTIVAVMMENHTYDNILGMMQGRGNGFTVAGGVPTNSNPWPKDSHVRPPVDNAVLRAFPMPNPCQQHSHPYNTWWAGKMSYAGGRMDGFVKSQSGPVSMGYYDSTYMPFIYSLASTFPVCDNYFSSVMAQTYPNRRFFMAGTSLGQVADNINFDAPPNGTIFEMLNKYGISWRNYYSGSNETSDASIGIWSYLLSDPSVYNSQNVVPIAEFFTDAANGTLPAYSMVDPNFGSSSEEDPQDVQFGDQFLSQVVNAVMSSPQWPNTMLVWTYDEGGGYYDHVPPPKAVKPDRVPPISGSHNPLGTPFGRYGFRVPSGVVSPYGKPDYVSSVVYDHTSVLKLVETKWNLPALTYRDANAADLLDTVDLSGTRAFLTPPALAAPADPSILEGCLTTGSGTIPPPGYVSTG